MSNITPARLVQQYLHAMSDQPEHEVEQVIIDLKTMHDAMTHENEGGTIPAEVVGRARGLMLLCQYGGGHWATQCFDKHPHTEFGSLR